MKKIVRYILIILIVSLGTAACEDKFDKQPLDAPSNANFYSTQAELELAINGAYNVFWWDLNPSVPPFIQVLDARTDLGWYRTEVGGLISMSRSEHSTDVAVAASTWGHFYSAIARANDLINNMERARDVVSAETFALIESQARFVRAFSYHFLSELYGDVPLLLETPTVQNAQLGRDPKNLVVQQIMEDLDFGIANGLPVEGDPGAPTVGAAYLLKARTALYNGDYQTAYESAQEVINLGVYSLHPSYEEQFNYAGKRSSAIILDMPVQRGLHTYETPVRYGIRNRIAGANGFSQNIPSQLLVDSYQCIDGLPIDQSPLYDPQNPFENRDPRLDASIIRPQTVFGGFVYETHPDSVETWFISAEGDSSRVTNLDTTNPFASFSGYCWRKYNDPLDMEIDRRSTDLHPIYMRYAEALLIYAEGKIEAGSIDASVLDALNQIRARAYGVDVADVANYPEITTTDQVELRRALRYERKIELAGEGFRWFDIKRWQIGDLLLNGNLVGRPRDGYSTITEAPEIRVDEGYHPVYANEDLYRTVDILRFDPARDYLFPIPQSERDANEVIGQNPGY